VRLAGLGVGELFGLRGEDVDWTARRVHARQAFVHGEFTLIYADYLPSSREAWLVDDAFRRAEIAVGRNADTRAAG
jgi:hypothetical protein